MVQYLRAADRVPPEPSVFHHWATRHWPQAIGHSSFVNRHLTAIAVSRNFAKPAGFIARF